MSGPNHIQESPKPIGPPELAVQAQEEIKAWGEDAPLAATLARCADEIESLYRQVMAAETALDEIAEAVATRHTRYVREVTGR